MKYKSKLQRTSRHRAHRGVSTDKTMTQLGLTLVTFF